MKPTVFHIRDILELPTWALIAIPVASIALYTFVTAIYGLYFHPLSKFPGPKLAAIYNISHTYWFINGWYPRTILELHKRYGPVVRTGPSQLSFCSASSWKDIYGHKAGRKQFLKSEFYEEPDQPTQLVTSRDIADHGYQRRLLSNAFSARALSEQEDTVQVYIDRLIAQIQSHATGPNGVEDMVMWFNFATFDIIGDLAFGEPFGSLKSGKEHFWVSTILGGVRAGAWIAMLRWYPAVRKMSKWIIPKNLQEKRLSHLQYTKDQVQKRMNQQTDRKDFMSHILTKDQALQMDFDRLVSNSSLFVVAGSETTATFLSGFLYFIVRNPHAYHRLTNEIRQNLPTYQSITNQNTESLAYLRAVIEETLRVYPPVPIGLPRDSPGETVDGMWIPKGTELFTSSYAATRWPDNWNRPDDYLPERWLKEKEAAAMGAQVQRECEQFKADKKEASNPFGYGSRVCLGRNLAMMEMRLIIAKLLYTYDVQLMDGGKLNWLQDNRAYTLWNKPNLPAKFVRRSEASDAPVKM